MLPIHYALRNALRSPLHLLQMSLGAGLVVGLLCFAAAFSQGMNHSLSASGDGKNVVVPVLGAEESIERSR